jgi:hypothetical protein
MTASTDLLESIEAIGRLLARLEEGADPRARAHAQAIVRGVLDFHRAGLARCLEIVQSAGARSDELVNALACDDLVGSMLALHGLHPVPVETRVRAALDRGCPSGWRVDRIDVQGAVVRVALALGADPRRAADPERVRAWAQDALARAVPDADSVECTVARIGTGQGGFVPVERLRGRDAPGGQTP